MNENMKQLKKLILDHFSNDVDKFNTWSRTNYDEVFLFKSDDFVRIPHEASYGRRPPGRCTKLCYFSVKILLAAEKIRLIPKNWKIDLKLSKDVVPGNCFVATGQVLESKGQNAMCKINLPLNSNQAATFFEWKLKIIHVGNRVENYVKRVDYYSNYTENVRKLVENEIQLGISSIQDCVFLSNRSDTVKGRGTNFKYNEEKIRVTFHLADVFSFQFDCTSGTLFVQKNDECRILIGFLKDVKSLQTDLFYPCVKFECPGDKIELLSAGPIHNLIYSFPTASSSTSNQASSVWFMIFAVCFAYYFNSKK